MKHIRKSIACAAALALLLCSCGSRAENSTEDTAYTAAESVSLLGAAYTVELANATKIDLSATSDVCITTGGTYLLSGSGNSTVTVDAKGETVVLALDNAAIRVTSGAAIDIENAALAVIYTVDGSENTLSGCTGDDTETNATLYSRDNLILDGKGSLSVADSGNNGIQGKDSVAVLAGDLRVDAANHGIKANDSLEIAGGTIDVTAGGDGLKAAATDSTDVGYVHIYDGDLSVTAGQDGIQAESALSVDGGVLSITTATGSNAEQISGGADTPMGFGFDFNSSAAADADTASYKGLKAGTVLTVNGGDLTVDSTDDALHSNGDAAILGGTLLLSSNDDGIHADATLSISGGDITIPCSYEGLEGANVTISGGTIDVTATDDGINVNGGDGSGTMGGFRTDSFSSDAASCVLTISGGNITVNAAGDGLDSNGDLTISGGTTIVNGPADNGNGAIDHNGTMTISGGVLLALGSSGMVENPSSASPQCALGAYLTGGSAGSTVTFTNGSVSYSITAARAFSYALLSCGEMTDGSEWTVSIDGSAAVSGSVSGGITSLSQSGASAGMGGGMGSMPSNGGAGGMTPPGARP